MDKGETRNTFDVRIFSLALLRSTLYLLWVVTWAYQTDLMKTSVDFNFIWIVVTFWFFYLISSPIYPFTSRNQTVWHWISISIFQIAQYSFVDGIINLRLPVANFMVSVVIFGLSLYYIYRNLTIERDISKKKRLPGVSDQPFPRGQNKLRWAILVTMCGGIFFGSLLNAGNRNFGDTVYIVTAILWFATVAFTWVSLHTVYGWGLKLWLLGEISGIYLGVWVAAVQIYEFLRMDYVWPLRFTFLMIILFYLLYRYVTRFFYLGILENQPAEGKSDGNSPERSKSDIAGEDQIPRCGACMNPIEDLSWEDLEDLEYVYCRYCGEQIPKYQILSINPAELIRNHRDLLQKIGKADKPTTGENKGD